MKLSIAQTLTVAASSCIGVALFIIAGSSANGGGGPGFGSQNNPGMQGSQFGQAAANGTGTQPTSGGPGFGPGNNPGVEGSAYGRSIANDASSGRAGGSDREEVIDTDSDSGKGKARSEEERTTNHTDTTDGTQVLTRISSETSVPVTALQAQKSATGLGYGGLETANLLAKASGQSVSDAHRSSSANGANSESSSLIFGPDIRENSILYTGITPIPSATVSHGINPVPSATMNPRP